MTTTTAPTVKDQELGSFGLVESASVNSFTDFIPEKLNESHVPSEKDDFINILICHLLFYGVFCISLALHILIDLGLGVFIKNKTIQLIGVRKKIVFENRPALA